MTLTTPLCPFGDDIVQAVEKTFTDLNIGDVRVELTFDPPWEPSEELRAVLGI